MTDQSLSERLLLARMANIQKAFAEVQNFVTLAANGKGTKADALHAYVTLKNADAGYSNCTWPDVMREAADALDALQAERDTLKHDAFGLIAEADELREVLREIADTRHLTAPQDIEEKAANHDVMIERAREVLGE